MLRRLFRLLLLMALLALVAWVASRALNREEDFDDFEDIDATLDFAETPVEIDVMNDSTAPAATQTAAVEAGGDNAAPSPAPAPVSTMGSLIDVKGIGPTYAARLHDIGVSSLEDLANADAGNIAERIEVIGERQTVQDWIDQAKQMISGRQATS